MIEFHVPVALTLVLSLVRAYLVRDNFKELDNPLVNPDANTMADFGWVSQNGIVLGCVKFLRSANFETTILLYHPQEKEIEAPRQWRLTTGDLEKFVETSPSELFNEISNYYDNFTISENEKNSISYLFRDFIIALSKTTLITIRLKEQENLNDQSFRVDGISQEKSTDAILKDSDRIIVDSLRLNMMDKEIALLIKKRPKTVSNRISLLREKYGALIIPYRNSWRNKK